MKSPKQELHDVPANLLDTSHSNGTIPDVRPSRAPKSRLRRAMVATAAGITLMAAYKVDQNASKVTTNRADVTFNRTAGNDTAAKLILAAEGNPHGDYTITATELSRAESLGGQITDGVHAGETVVGVELPTEPTGTHDEYNKKTVDIEFTPNTPGIEK